jgi:prolyl oligopeptidase
MIDKQSKMRKFFNPKKLWTLITVFVSFYFFVSAQSIHEPPKAKRMDFVENIHGHRIPDPYRWLEDQWSAETRKWLAGQKKYAESILESLPSVEQVKKVLEPVYAIEKMSEPSFAEGHYYYMKKPKGAERYAVFAREGLYGEEKIVLDPKEISDDLTVTIGMRGVYAKGKYLAYNVRDGGEDEVTIRIRSLETGKDLDDVVSRGMHWRFSFNNAGDGFYYSLDDKTEGGKVFFHKLGTDVKEDKVVFKADRRECWANAYEIEDGKRLFGNLGIGWQRQEFYIKDLEIDGDWTPIIKGIDAQFQPRWVEKKLWVVTDYKAPFGRVVEIDLDNPAPENWLEIVPENDAVLNGLTLIEDKLFLRYLRDAVPEIHVCKPDGTFIRKIELPDSGNVSLPSRTEEKGLFMFTFQSFTQPFTIFIYDPETTEKKIWYQDASEIDTLDFIVKQEWCESDDGTRVPMWIVHKEGIELDGNNPTLLNGYGGFNVAILPSFSGYNALWIRQGGVFVLANLRGGSEFGRAWHKGGMLRHKQNVFDDFIAVAEHLIERGYTNPTKLAIKGGSNGGLLMGAAFTQRPDLFQAVVARVPEFDLVGFPRYKNINPPALMEYGDASKPDQFDFIIRWSPYQNVRKGVVYPAILVVTGDMDSRVDPVQARKTVAKLQWATSTDRPIILNYNPRMGHAGGRSLSKQLHDAAWEMAFLNWQLRVKPAEEESFLVLQK